MLSALGTRFGSCHSPWLLLPWSAIAAAAGPAWARRGMGRVAGAKASQLLQPPHATSKAFNVHKTSSAFIPGLWQSLSPNPMGRGTEEHLCYGAGGREGDPRVRGCFAGPGVPSHHRTPHIRATVASPEAFPSPQPEFGDQTPTDTKCKSPSKTTPRAKANPKPLQQANCLRLFMG